MNVNEECLLQFLNNPKRLEITTKQLIKFRTNLTFQEGNVTNKFISSNQEMNHTCSVAGFMLVNNTQSSFSEGAGNVRKS